ncbi:MAG: DedA family protein [Candidatus Tyrphobacter sp.]
MEHLQNAILALVYHYGYLGLFIGLVLGNVGFPVAAELLVPAAGALLARGRWDSLVIVIAVAVAGELVGGTIGYAIGRFGGRTVAQRYGKYVGFHYDRLDSLHAFFGRWGTFAVFLCRFTPMIRGISPFVAGVAKMDLLAFYVWTFLGSTIFCGGLALLGSALGVHVRTVLPLLRHWGYAVAAVALIVVLVAIVGARSRAGRAAPPRA